MKSKQSLPPRKTARWSNNLHCHKYRKYFLYVCMRLRCPQALSRLLCKFLDGILVGLTQTQLADGITRAALYEREKVLSHHDYWNRAHCQARLCQVYSSSLQLSPDRLYYNSRSVLLNKPYNVYSLSRPFYWTGIHKYTLPSPWVIFQLATVIPDAHWQAAGEEFLAGIGITELL